MINLISPNMMKNIWFKLCVMLFVDLNVNFVFFESIYCEKLKIYKLQPIKLGVLRNGIKQKYKFTLKTLL